MFRADAIYEEIYGLYYSLDRSTCWIESVRINKEMAELIAEYERLTGCTWEW